MIDPKKLPKLPKKYKENPALWERDAYKRWIYSPTPEEIRNKGGEDGYEYWFNKTYPKAGFLFPRYQSPVITNEYNLFVNGKQGSSWKEIKKANKKWKPDTNDIDLEPIEGQLYDSKAYGGKLDKDPKQLKEVTIYADTNNPRYKSYKDSLDLYTGSKKDYERRLIEDMDSWNKRWDELYEWMKSRGEDPSVLGKRSTRKDWLNYGEKSYPIKIDSANHRISDYEPDYGWYDLFANGEKESPLYLNKYNDPFAYKHINDSIKPVSARYSSDGLQNLFYKKPINEIRIPARNIRIQPKSVTQIDNKPTIEQRPYTPVNTKRGDRIFFNYSPGGKNNYINYGEGKGIENLSNEEASKLYNNWNDSGLMYRLGESGQSNYGGIKKFVDGGPLTTNLVGGDGIPTNKEMSDYSKSLDIGAFNWYNDRLSSPSSKARIANQLSKYDGLNKKDSIDTAGKFSKAYINMLNRPSLEYYNLYAIADKFAKKNVPKDISSQIDYIGGLSTGNTIISNPKSKSGNVYSTDLILTHELAHNIGLDLNQDAVITHNLGSDEIYRLNDTLNTDYGYDLQKFDTKEIIPRFYEGMRASGKPSDYIYKLEDIPDFKKNIPFFENVKDENILKVLNELAYTNNIIGSSKKDYAANTNQMPQYLAYGGPTTASPESVKQWMTNWLNHPEAKNRLAKKC